MLLSTLLLGVCACAAYEASFEDCAVSCAADAECPAGLTCNDENMCRAPKSSESCAAVLGTAPSCVGLPATCGPGGDEDCCATAEVAGGSFFRSYDVSADGMYPSTSYPATVSAFSLDRFEVTVGRFRRFVEAGMGTRERPPAEGISARVLNATVGQGGWDPSWSAQLPADTEALRASLHCDVLRSSWTDARGDNEALPVNCVTWFQAFAFCAWDGGFLPTEAEAQYAAAGGSEQRAYPWSEVSSAAIDCTYANYEGCGNAVKPVGTTSPKGDGRWGQADLAGNLWEWALDRYVNPYSAASCQNCANLSTGSQRVNRGGSFSFAAAYLRSAFRGYEAPEPHYATIGVRCARGTP